MIAAEIYDNERGETKGSVFTKSRTTSLINTARKKTGSILQGYRELHTDLLGRPVDLHDCERTPAATPYHHRSWWPTGFLGSS